MAATSRAELQSLCYNEQDGHQTIIRFTAAHHKSLYQYKLQWIWAGNSSVACAAYFKQ